MASFIPEVSPEQTSPAPGPGRPKPQRVLACVLCSQRKVKCDRRFPCSNCVKFRAECVPATVTKRQRRRRLPERDLSDRLRQYEDLLRRNNIAFEPLMKEPAGDNEPANDDNADDSDGLDMSTPTTGAGSESRYEAKNILFSITRGFRDAVIDSESPADEALQENTIKQAWVDSVDHADHLLFGARAATVDISTLHPDPVQIFKLWQIYLDNVNPLLKVTHTPSLQGRIIEAASNVTAIHPVLEALMFSIYCTSVLSLQVEECQAMFGAARDELLTRYQFACQQALLNCNFLRTGDRDCLTALYLYLISVRPGVVPQSLHSMLGIATRIAQRMGIHNEASLAECSVFEAEMRRRLWWSLMLFDSRIGQLASSKTVPLDPTWDCRVPLNVNDSDLRPEMKEPPPTNNQGGGCTETLFAVVRSEIADFVRYAEFHLDFTSPALKAIAKQQHQDKGSDLSKLASTIQEKYLRSCDPDNPLHFMTTWTTRSYLAKCRLMDHHSRYSASCVVWTANQRDAATTHALTMLECDTKVMTSPLTARFRWFNHFYFPFLAYIHLVQDMQKHPTSERAAHAWEIMSDNFEAWFSAMVADGDSPVLKLFARLIMGAWDACEAAAVRNGETNTLNPPPRIVASLREALARMAGPSQGAAAEQQPDFDMGLGTDDFMMPVRPMVFNGQAQPSVPGFQDNRAMMGSEMFPAAYTRNQMDWTAFGGWPGWGSF
ncbi:hypothetical protein H2200_013237 [Cladophialophora chaetospira]|uniref:Zn(2)-C6 fungal-type domain-containing protein n=1 Tax=Cladophialophora chaetospira TaxID=386627 RepID=A0AA38WWG0_9EURO|nr:hypothetical protein H2200_013237 [Cladophialophora chaetospira]